MTEPNRNAEGGDFNPYEGLKPARRRDTPSFWLKMLLAIGVIALASPAVWLGFLAATAVRVP